MERIAREPVAAPSVIHVAVLANRGKGEDGALEKATTRSKEADILLTNTRIFRSADRAADMMVND